LKIGWQLRVKKHLPNVFSKLIGDVSTIEKIASDRGSNPYKTTSTERQHGDAIKQASSNSVSWTHLEPSVRRAVISNVQAPKLNYGLEKFAEGSEKYAELAKAYAVNQLQWIKAASSTPAHEFLYGKVVVAYNRLS
jgi:hypothetical protein